MLNELELVYNQRLDAVSVQNIKEFLPSCTGLCYLFKMTREIAQNDLLQLDQLDYTSSHEFMKDHKALKDKIKVLMELEAFILNIQTDQKLGG